MVTLVCPKCKNPLEIVDGGSRCPQCPRDYPGNNFLLEMDFSNMGVWNKLQEHGVLSYDVDPTNNLSVDFQRQDVVAFAKFCTLRGTILDIGCGPQPVPAYAYISPDSEYYGIDPIKNDTKYFHYYQAYCEALPFTDNAFDVIIFATTLDHLIDVDAAIKEVKRVLKPGGKVFLWQGLKSTNVFAKVIGFFKDRGRKKHFFISPDAKPPEAEDLFHQKRFTPEDITRIFADGFRVKRKEIFRKDIIRYNLFYEFEKV